MVPPRAATALRSYVSIVMTIGVSVGAPLGGALTQWIGWRWGFILQVPLSLTCLAMISWRLRTTRIAQKPENERQTTHHQDFNLLGVFLLGLSVASLMVFCQFSVEFKSKSTLGLSIILTIFFASILLFGINERYWTGTPLIPLQLIKTSGIGSIYLSQILLFFSYGGVGRLQIAFHILADRYCTDLQSYHRILDPQRKLCQHSCGYDYTANYIWKYC